MEALDNKCPACGAKSVYNPKTSTWTCEYCLSSFTLEEMQKHVNASSEKENKKEGKSKKQNLDLYNCKNCGATIIADENTTATFCVYCGSTAILKDKMTSTKVPDLIIPFAKEKQDAIDGFEKVTKRKPLMPKAFKTKNNIKKITGVYIPFWGYDITCDGTCDFDCKDIQSWTAGGYNYTKTDVYKTTIEEHSEYKKVLADASSHFDDNLMDSLEPFSFDGLKEYNHAYLSGFYAEKYDVDEIESKKRASQRTMNTCVDIAKQNTPHATQTVTGNHLNLNVENIYYLMLPVWMMNIKYKDKIYTFAMNGQTGKVVGNIPIDIKKLIIYSILLFIFFFILFFTFFTRIV